MREALIYQLSLPLKEKLRDENLRELFDLIRRSALYLPANLAELCSVQVRSARSEKRKKKKENSDIVCVEGTASEAVAETAGEETAGQGGA